LVKKETNKSMDMQLNVFAYKNISP